MNIDTEVKQAIEQLAKVKIQEALGEDILGKIINEVMSRKTRDSRGFETKTTVLDELVQRQIEALFERILREEIFSSSTIRETIKAAVADKAEAFSISIVDAFQNGDWQANLTVKIDRD